MLSFNDSQVKIRDGILENIPKEAEVSRIEFEGPRLAIYVKRPEILVEQSYIVTDLVKLLRKRIVIRSDPSVRLPEPEARKLILSKLSDEAEVTSIEFDPTVGEVVIEAKKPGLVIGKSGSALEEIIKSTKWRPRVLRTPPIPSKIIASVRHYFQSEVKRREEILRSVGDRIFRPAVLKSNGVRITTLGGFQEVGRSAFLVNTGESRILIDCGVNPGSNNPVNAYPYLNADEFDLNLIDAVIISHAHLDHCGMLPFLYKYGYDGPVYCSEPTASLMTLLQLDSLDVLIKEGLTPPYDQKDVRETVLHVIPLKYGAVTDIAPDVRLTLHNAGHILGSAITHMHIGQGLHNIVYTGDFKHGRTMLLEPASTNFPRIETLIIEGTYGGPEDVMPKRMDVERNLVSVINETLDKGGKTLIPVPAVGRAQEIMIVLDNYMKNGLLQEAPIYIEGMINEATAIHTTYPEYLDRRIRDQILYEGVNPFESDYFVNVKDPSARQDIIKGEPSIILATSGMMEGGPSIEYFKALSSDERNTLIFVSYQIEGTLGSRIKRGLSEVPLMDHNGKMAVVKIALRVVALEGFSGHSDRNQCIDYVRRLSRPERIIVGHGEKAKCISTASALHRIYKVDTDAPKNLETIRLR